MDKIIKIREYLANEFKNDCLVDELLSFSVDMECNFDQFANFATYPFKIRFPGLVVRFQNDWKTQFKNCLSIKFMCNFDLHSLEINDEGAIAISEALKINSTLREINLYNDKIGDEGVAAIAEALKINFTLQAIYLREQIYITAYFRRLVGGGKV